MFVEVFNDKLLDRLDAVQIQVSLRMASHVCFQNTKLFEKLNVRDNLPSSSLNTPISTLFERISRASTQQQQTGRQAQSKVHTGEPRGFVFMQCTPYSHVRQMVLDPARRCVVMLFVPSR